MSQGPLVTIVTPSFNQGQFIEDTIQSVLNQEYTNIEYLVVDGGSTDDTISILKKYGGRLRWVSERDRGQADAIMKGFEMSRGDILCWLNSDDTLLPGAIQSVAALFESRPETGMVYGKTYYTDEAGKIISEYATEPFDFKRLATVTFICQPSTFFKRDVFFDAGGLNRDLQYTMDYDLWIRIAEKVKVEYLPEFVSTYRLHGTSKTISDLHALKFTEEYLMTVVKYYRRAPFNRVYGYCFNLVSSRLPRILGKITPLVTTIALFVTIKEYIKLNRGIRLDDLKLLTLQNAKKFFRGSDGSPRM
jgi:glycosyltransferase involved in cell wall biosynthesis